MTNPAFQLEIQKYLKSFSSLPISQENLQKDFAIDIKTDFLHFSDGAIEPVWIYNYNQFNSRGKNPIENEARALILNINHEIVSMSFGRFFNHNEKNAAELDWHLARIEEKLDGSLIVIYSYRNEMFIQTRNSAEASEKVGEKTYKEAVMEILSEKNPGDPFAIFKKERLLQNITTWVFEYTGPDNHIITPYDKSDLYCLSMFRKDLGIEVPYKFVRNWAKEYGFKQPTAYFGVESKEVAEEFVKREAKGLDEGFVVVDEQNNRVKMKNPGYLSVARALKSGETLSPKHFANIVLKGDAEETAACFSKYSDVLDIMSVTLEELLNEADDAWHLHRSLDSQKEFAAAVKNQPLSHILFMARKGKVRNVTGALSHVKSKILLKEVEKRHKDVYGKILEKTLMK